jgi:glucose/arabinose dehydrogenase
MKKSYRTHTLIFLFLALSSGLVAQTFMAGFSQVKVGTVSNPTSMAFAPDGRIFVTEKTGKVRIVKNGKVLPSAFLTLKVDQTGERGLISITTDPNFSSNHYVYVFYTTATAPVHNRVSRFTAKGDVVVSSSEKVIIDLEPSVSTTHNGGGLAFGADGKLYIATGNDDIKEASQDVNSLKGKVLRINTDGSAAENNPFTSSENAKKVWAVGLQNPLTIDIQQETNKIFVNDIGDRSWEEINDASTAGNNFGFPTVEGFSSTSTYTNPVHAYPRGKGGSHSGCAIAGGTFFNPTYSKYPTKYSGKYFFIDYCNDWINYLDPENPKVRYNFASGLQGTCNYLKVGTDGDLYYLSINEGAIYKLAFSKFSVPLAAQAQDDKPVTKSISESHTSSQYKWQNAETKTAEENSSSTKTNNHEGGKIGLKQ